MIDSRNPLVAVIAAMLATVLGVMAADTYPTRLPDGVMPVIGCWFWRETEFAPGGYRAFLDTVAKHATYNLLTTSMRCPDKEITSPDVHDQIKQAAAYARQCHMGVVMDLDVRLARAAFQKAFPDELQEMLRLRELTLAESGEVTFQIQSSDLGDHYTFRAKHYVPLAGRLVRVYSYGRGPAGIEPESVEDITKTFCTVKEATAKRVSVAIACGEKTKGRRACVIAAFTHFTPDVFAPHLLKFQRQVIAQYADAPLAGVCKDEWGFPPCSDGNPAKDDYWYSRFFAAAYAARTGGRDLVRDALLMWAGERGRQGERRAAINHFMKLCRERNAAIEDDFYRATKATFGRAAVVATHPTWQPYPFCAEFKKNGLDWWAATRDIAQTDEVTPHCVRTALAKKWGSPVCYNMFYARAVPSYEKNLWMDALASGRINYHPIYPNPKPAGWRQETLLCGGLTRGDSRIRLLNFISTAPLDCPVAVVFGHACAMNWAGPAYDDVGMELANRLWRTGFYADLIPTSEITSGALKVAADGSIHYGKQRYAAVVLYHPEFEQPRIATFFQQAARSRTPLFRIGDWTSGFDGKPFDGNAALPKAMVAVADAALCASQVVERLRGLGVPPQEPATENIGWGSRVSAAPPPKGQSRLIDGTRLLLSGAKNVAGDPIQAAISVNGREVKFEAEGVAAVRLSNDGRLVAMTGGGLKHFRVGEVNISLERPADIALWRDARGRWRGVLQDWDGPVPAPLAAITQDWLRLSIPAKLKMQEEGSNK